MKSTESKGFVLHLLLLVMFINDNFSYIFQIKFVVRLIIPSEMKESTQNQYRKNQEIFFLSSNNVTCEESMKLLAVTWAIDSLESTFAKSRSVEHYLTYRLL